MNRREFLQLGGTCAAHLGEWTMFSGKYFEGARRAWERETGR